MFYKLDNRDEEEDINTDTAFEYIRQLMLKEKIFEAVTYLWKVCIKLKQKPDIENLSPEAKEECLFLFLLKTFMESENNLNNIKENIEKKQSIEENKEKEEIIAIKRVINYLRVCFYIFYIDFNNYLIKNYIIILYYSIVWNLQLN